ncbi:MAG TPA: ATP-dependent protease subunit HslV [Candidatus Latescibacteria bacterium]|nr:ATP-dependent protease subunit HslV [Candidatus Latescibacterota bacterium]
MKSGKERVVATTILGIRRGGKAALGCDGQITIGERVMKHNARKVQKIYNGTILAGYAGAAADAITLFERFEAKLEQFHGNLRRAAVELTKDWRMDKYLRRLEAILAAMDRDYSLVISGEGEVIEPDDGIVALGSGGAYALAAAKAYLDSSKLDARTIVRKSLEIASSIDVYTNDKIIIEEL